VLQLAAVVPNVFAGGTREFSHLDPPLQALKKPYNEENNDTVRHQKKTTQKTN
jgi:hypothetical protein